MTISYPRTDIMTFVPYGPSSVPLRLQQRQELSRTAGGITVGKDLGSPIWVGDFTTAILPIDDMVEFEAMMNSLDGVVGTFEAGDMRRPYPKAHSSGVFNDTGALYDVHSSNKAIRLAGLDIGFHLSVGDYLSFNYGTARALHQVMEAAAAVSGGVTDFFEVRPHIRTGWVLSPSTSVTLKKPKGVFTMTPGSLSSQMSGPIHGTVQFSAVQYF